MNHAYKMINTDLPSDHIPVVFTDKDGVQHRGIYNERLKAFIERVGEETIEDAGITYSIENIAYWEYEDDEESSDPDILDIL